MYPLSSDSTLLSAICGTKIPQFALFSGGLTAATVVFKSTTYTAGGLRDRGSSFVLLRGRFSEAARCNEINTGGKSWKDVVSWLV
jgi:hypothetical protein